MFWDDLLTTLRSQDPQSAREIVEHSADWSFRLVDVKGRHRVRIEGGGYGIGRHKLLDILTERATELGVEVRFEHEIAHAGQLPHADLIVAAEGVGSRLRRQHADRFGSQVHVGRNKYVWLGTTQAFAAFTFSFVPTESGWIWFHAYPFGKDMSTVIVECAPETWLGSVSTR